MEWLNGPLVWAIDEWHRPMYLFPRDCPRILLWPTPSTSEEDLKRYFDGSNTRGDARRADRTLERLGHPAGPQDGLARARHGLPLDAMPV